MRRSVSNLLLEDVFPFLNISKVYSPLLGDAPVQMLGLEGLPVPVPVGTRPTSHIVSMLHHPRVDNGSCLGRIDKESIVGENLSVAEFRGIRRTANPSSEYSNLNVLCIRIGVTSAHAASIVECLTLLDDLPLIQIGDVRVVHYSNGHIVQCAIRIIDLVDTLEQNIAPSGIFIYYLSSERSEDTTT